MEFTVEQQEQIRTWLAQGESLSEVQNRIKSEFGIVITYMDLRMLVLELGASVKDKPEPQPKVDKGRAAGMPPGAPRDEIPHPADFEDEEGYAPQDEAPFDDDGTDDGVLPRVTVTIDRIVRPGAMISGEVVFGDGEKGAWLIDEYGRFGLDPQTPGYQPSQEQLQSFQNTLRTELRRHGYG